MAGDGQIKYDHDYDGQGQEAGGCHFEYRNTKEPTKIRIISLPDGVKMEYKTSADIGFNVCFVANVTVPSNPYLGFTAMTGGVSARHEIIVVEIYKITVTRNLK